MLLYYKNSGSVGGGDTDRTFYASSISKVGLAVKRIAGQVGKLFGIYKEDNSFLVGFDNTGAMLLRPSTNVNDFNLMRSDAVDHGFSMYGNSVNRVMRFGSSSYTMDLSKNGLTFYNGQTFLRPNGQGYETTPSYSWRGDTDTGIWKPLSNTIGLTCGGANRLTLDTQKAAFSVPVKLEINQISVLPPAVDHYGSIMFDSDNNKVIYSDGVNWKDFSGVIVA